MKSRGHLPWKAITATSSNALSEVAIARIAARHQLPKDNVEALGMELALCLAGQRTPRGAIDLLFQAKAGDRARNDIITRAARAIKDVEGIRDSLKRLDSTLGGKTGTNTGLLLKYFSKRLIQAFADLSVLKSVLEMSEKADEPIYDFTATNKRKEKDEVRLAVVRELFLFWEEMGRRVTITTVTGRERTPRSGAFIAFVTDVVLELTDPSTAINGETLKSDIKEVRKFEAFIKRFEAYAQNEVSMLQLSSD